MNISQTTQIVANSKFDVFARSCAMGLPYAPQENQDCYHVFVKKHDEREYIVSIVCDGHGCDGLYFAQQVCEYLKTEIAKDKQFQKILENPKPTLSVLFNDFNDDLEDDLMHQTNKCVDGGTTATVLIQTAGRCIVANVGDCDAFIQVRNDNEETQMVRLTTDHSGDSDAEIWRVDEHAGCKLIYGLSSHSSRRQPEPVSVCKTVLGQIQIDEAGKIQRVPFETVPGVYYMNVQQKIATYFYCIQNGAKLACGRSFGNYNAPFVTAVPSVLDFTYSPEFSATVIMGSDGYFNCLTKEQLNAELKSKDGGKAICDRSIRYVENTFGVEGADNMTVVAIHCKGNN